MSDEDKMRSEFEKQHAIHFELTRHGEGYFYSNEQDSWDKFKECWEAATKACAAIKDAEIATRDNYVEELRARERNALKEIAARDLMIKEWESIVDRLLTTKPGAEFDLAIFDAKQLLAKSEHHNSRALEKMLLEARIDELHEVQDYFVRKDSYAWSHLDAMITERKAKLVELNKE